MQTGNWEKILRLYQTADRVNIRLSWQLSKDTEYENLWIENFKKDFNIQSFDRHSGYNLFVSQLLWEDEEVELFRMKTGSNRLGKSLCKLLPEYFFTPMGEKYGTIFCLYRFKNMNIISSSTWVGDQPNPEDSFTPNYFLITQSNLKTLIEMI